jgi:hypothetical protein
MRHKLTDLHGRLKVQASAFGPPFSIVRVIRGGGGGIYVGGPYCP